MPPIKSKTSPRRYVRIANGFTLVELLVVVGVIAVLVAILLPALQRARIVALKVQCASNLRQISMGSLMYANENHGYLPLVGGAYGWYYVTAYTNIIGAFWPPWSMYSLRAYGINDDTGSMDVAFTQRYNLQKVKQCPLRDWDHQLSTPFGFWLPVANPTTRDFGYSIWEGRAYHRTDYWNEFTGPQKTGRAPRRALASDIVYKCIGDGNSIGYGWFSAHARNDIVDDAPTFRNNPISPEVGDMNIAYTDGSVVRLQTPEMTYIFYAYVWWYGDGPMTATDPH